MTIEKLREAYHAEPFLPFTVSLADGRRFYVPSREFMFIPPRTERTFIVVDGDDSWSILDLLLVSSIDFTGPKKHRTNGHTRRR